ncbi:hypothetical protein ACHCAI_001030 [Enterobacter asburiae]
MSDKKQILTADQQDFVFRTKANLLAELIKFQIPNKSDAEELAEVVNAAFAKLTA